MNGTDACFVGLGDILVSSSEKESMLSSLVEHQWNIGDDLSEQVTQVLKSVPKPEELPQANIEPHMSLINELCSGNSAPEVVNAILTNNVEGDKWLTRAQSTLAKGSPITMHLVFEQCQRGGEMSLADCFRMEVDMSCRCGEQGEFQEGVRALLIDKDMSPKWQYASVEDVPATVVEQFFTSPWEGDKHPLAQLGR